MGRIHTRIRFFSVTRPHTVTVQGLFEVLQAALQNMGMQSVDANYCHRLVGIATDGASANVAGGGLKESLSRNFPEYFGFCVLPIKWSWQSKMLLLVIRAKKVAGPRMLLTDFFKNEV